MKSWYRGHVCCNITFYISHKFANSALTWQNIDGSGGGVYRLYVECMCGVTFRPLKLHYPHFFTGRRNRILSYFSKKPHETRYIWQTVFSNCPQIPHTSFTNCVILSHPSQTNSLWAIKNFPSFYIIRRFISSFTRTRHRTLYWARWIQSSTEIPIYLIVRSFLTSIINYT
jgi:hypothetical protein